MLAKVNIAPNDDAIDIGSSRNDIWNMYPRATTESFKSVEIEGRETWEP